MGIHAGKTNHYDMPGMFVAVPPMESYPKCFANPQTSLREGDEITLQCMSKGAAPVETLTWYNGSKRIASRPDTYLHVRITVTKSDNGKELSCTAENGATQMLGIVPNCSLHLSILREYNNKPILKRG